MYKYNSINSEEQQLKTCQLYNLKTKMSFTVVFKHKYFKEHILNFNYLQEDNFINNYLYYNKKTKKMLSDLCEIIYIELPKFNIAHKDYNDKIHIWLTFLANLSGEEIQDMAKTDGEIKEAMDILYDISSDKELRRLIDLRELAIMDEQNRLNGAKKDGREQGESWLLIKQLTKKFKMLPDEYKNKIMTLPEEKLETIGLEIFDMESIEDLKKYIN